MIKIKASEWEENNTAYSKKCITFLGIPVFKREDTTTQQDVVNSLKQRKINKIKGFRNNEN